jgi:hypothetical protein
VTDQTDAALPDTTVTVTNAGIREWRGLTSTVNYTLGKSMDNASDGQDYVPNASQPDDSRNPDAEWAPSNFRCASDSCRSPRRRMLAAATRSLVGAARARFSSRRG